MSAERRRYRGVLFGWGGIARLAHYPAYVGSPDVAGRLELVALVDGVGDGRDLPGITYVPSRDGLAALRPIDFIDICTPTASHLDLVLWGLGQGYHVLCEKPVALTSAEAGQIRAAAAAARRIVAPCHQYRFNPAWRQLRAWLDAGEIGRWHLAEFRVLRPHADPGVRAGITPWRGVRQQSRGGVLLDHGTHLLYLLLDVAGPPADVRGWTGRLRHRHYDVEDTAQVLLEYPGALASVFVSWSGSRRENWIRFTGERGTITWAGGELCLDRDGRREVIDFSAALDKAAYREWFARLLADFADAMDRGDGAQYLDEIAKVSAILEQAYESAAHARWAGPPVAT